MTRLVIYGKPRTKKNSSTMARAGGRNVLLPSKAWREWTKSVTTDPALPPQLPDQPYNCTALFYRDANRGDAVGFYQGLADILEKMGVVSNDKWIVSWDGSRLLKDAENPRVEITLTPVVA